MNTTENTTPQFPNNWRIASDFDPNAHMMTLQGREYLNVQNRLLWFVKDQRDFIVRGLAQMPYVIRSEVVELDTERGYAHFRTYVRDVLGNEATMYGSETVKDFKDYAEKASTKSLGRALAVLGYGTQYAAEMDEGERVVDTPVERPRKPTPIRPQNAPTRAPQAQQDAPAREAAQSSPRNERPASAPDDSTALTHASDLDQKRLYGQLAAHQLHGNGGFLRNVTGREVDVEKLREGRSDITVREMAIVQQRLSRLPSPARNGQAAQS